MGTDHDNATGADRTEAASLEELRRGPLGDYIRWFEQHARPGARSKEGVWRWSVDTINDEHAPWPFPTPHEMVKGHKFEEYLRYRTTWEDGAGEHHTDSSGYTLRCRELLAFCESGRNFTGEGGISLEVYPSVNAWDAAADELRARQTEMDLEEEEGPRWYREGRRDAEAAEIEARAQDLRSEAHDSLIAKIYAASHRVREDLTAIADRAAYLWPVPAPKLWSGFSYEIPKEEQVRSAFWAALHDRASLVCELEWNVYEQGARGVRVSSEIDLVGFDVANGTSGAPGPDLFLEFKQVRSLNRWNNKPDEQRAGLECDVRKLRAVVKTLSSGTDLRRPTLAGIVVATFAHTTEALDTEIDRFHPDLEDFGLRRVELANEPSPLCRAPIDAATIYDVFVRFDLLILEETIPR